MPKPFHILLLSAGSLLAQNILDNLENRRDKVRITGLNSSSANPRIYRCDKVYLSPLIDSPNFKTFLYETIKRERPNTILPGRDHDVVALAELAHENPDLRSLIPGGSIKAIKIMNDKRLSSLFSKEYDLPYAQSAIPQKENFSEVYNLVSLCGFPIIAKPSEGFGSLGIRILCNETQLETFLSRNPEGFIFQEFIGFSEESYNKIDTYNKDISMGVPLFFHLPDENQFAGQTIIKSDGSIGEIFTSRSLMVLGRCEKSELWIDPAFTELTRKYAEAIADKGWRGVFNLQCRRTQVGRFVGSEMSGRMTGSTSARGYLGYDEIRILIKEFYGIDIGKDSRYKRDNAGVVYRSLTDYYVSGKDKNLLDINSLWEKKKENIQEDNRTKKSPVRTVLITGSTGFIGQNFVKKLIKKENYEVIVISRNKTQAKKLFESDVSQYFSYEDILDGKYLIDNTSLLFHLGFARPHNGNYEIARSLELTAKLFSYTVQCGIQGIVNISSRSVYGNSDNPPWDEETPTNPSTIYGQAKLGAELLLSTLINSYSNTFGTSIRLGTVISGSSGLVDVSIISKLIKQALKSDPIHIFGGTQNFDFLHVDDATDAFISLLETPISSWKPTYTLGSTQSYNIVTIAERCVALSSQFLSNQTSQIIIEKGDSNVDYGLDSSLFQEDMNWHPKKSIDDIITSLINFYQIK